MKIAIICLFINVGFNILFFKPFGYIGIVLSSVISSYFNITGSNVVIDGIYLNFASMTTVFNPGVEKGRFEGELLLAHVRFSRHRQGPQSSRSPRQIFSVYPPAPQPQRHNRRRRQAHKAPALWQSVQSQLVRVWA